MSRSRVVFYQPNPMFRRPTGSRSARGSAGSRSRVSPFSPFASPQGATVVPIYVSPSGGIYENPYFVYPAYPDEPLQTVGITMGPRELGAAGVLGAAYGARGGSPTYYQPMIQELRSQHAQRVARSRPGYAGLIPAAAARAAMGGAAAGAGGGAPAGLYLMPSSSGGNRGSRGSRAGGAAGLAPSRSSGSNRRRAGGAAGLPSSYSSSLF
jgi:hypothetical protein